MLSSALEIIQAIQDRANKEIESLKAEALSDVVKKLSAAKSAVADLERQYEELTGKTVRGEKVARKRLSNEQKASLVIRVGEIIQVSKDGISMGDIVKQAGEPVSAVRVAVHQVKGLKRTGSKATTLYFVK